LDRILQIKNQVTVPLRRNGIEVEEPLLELGLPVEFLEVSHEEIAHFGYIAVEQLIEGKNPAADIGVSHVSKVRPMDRTLPSPVLEA
jgi:hypothetical protein